MAGGSAVAIGVYDGVHVGHQMLLRQMIVMAKDRGLKTTVITFDCHPKALLKPESAPPLLCDFDQKLELLRKTGIDDILVLHFDRKQANQSAEEFIREVLVDQLQARLVVVGKNFHFGHGRKGTVELLSQMGDKYGFETLGFDMLKVAGEAVSSTRIRHLVASGEMGKANRLLGRFHQVRGTVVHGDGRGGADLGYPTANLNVPDDILLPKAGIYAGWVRLGDGVYCSAVSIGKRPTFYDDLHDDQNTGLVLEVYLTDFSGDLYGKILEVYFVKFLRDEKKFDHIEDLIHQMEIDVADTKQLLNSPNNQFGRYGSQEPANVE